MRYALTVHFPGWYIGNPYWQEMWSLIEITKESGMSRARASQNRRKALEEYLRSKDMTLDDYEQLERDARRPFHLDDQGRIIIPAERVISFLVATTDEARAAMRPCAKEQVRNRFQVTNWATEKLKPDGKWSRFVIVQSGTGAKLSNQRGLREDFYIEKFDASGELECDPQFVNVAVLKNVLEWGGQFVGIGASRKMGHGRFVIKEFEQQS
jgi:hypothetical protein